MPKRIPSCVVPREPSAARDAVRGLVGVLLDTFRRNCRSWNVPGSLRQLPDEGARLADHFSSMRPNRQTASAMIQAATNSPTMA